MKDYWAAEAAGILKGMLIRDGITYKRLSLMLAARGFDESERQLRNRINRGAFSFSFFLRCMTAMGYEDVRFTVRSTKPGATSKRETPRIS